MSSKTEPVLDAVVVGAGFAGMYMLHRLRGLGLRALVLETGDGVGGTWYWNRYPGARCDIESMQYSYQFSEELQQEWSWSERYSPQPEILEYANHVADRFDLRRDIRFATTVTSAHFDDEASEWTVRTDEGDVLQARFFIMATGCLSSTNLPEFEGLGEFRGAWYHTGRWPHEPIDFTGKRVAVIGTGSSAIQSIPVIARQAAHLTVFQRTPNFSVPAHNGPLDREREAQIKAHYGDFRASAAQTGFGMNTAANEASALEVGDAERAAVYEERWADGGLPFITAFADLGSSQEANDTAADFVREKIRGLVEDPAVAELLCPDSVLGCKRLCVDTGYYETFNRDNVTLVDVSRSPVEQIRPEGVEVNGEVTEVDVIVFATGFDAMTGSLHKVDIRGRGGVSLKSHWAEGPKTYLGLTSAGFPNFFTITGPGSPSVLSNMIPSIEQHVNFIADCLAHLQDHGLGRVEAEESAEEGWGAVVNGIADATLYPSCNSWYLGANIPGKPRVFMPYLGFGDYVEKCKEIVAKGYEGFRFG